MKKLILLTLSALLLTSCGTVEDEVALVVPTPAEPEHELYFGQEYQADLYPMGDGPELGTVMSTVSYSDSEYVLAAAFFELPELEEGFFYEGWLVRTEGELSVISTGAIENNMNFYVSEIDLSDHTQYILTLEPDDGDPAPADHVLEGTFTLTN